MAGGEIKGQGDETSPARVEISKVVSAGDLLHPAFLINVRKGGGKSLEKAIREGAQNKKKRKAL